MIDLVLQWIIYSIKARLIVGFNVFGYYQIKNKLKKGMI